jgi:DNA-binding transcriptional LysR family regulator
MAEFMTGHLPDWNEIHDVLLIHDAGSLSAAARLAGVSQSTMSRRLAAIEAGGHKVFARGPAGMLALTERGEALVAVGRQMEAAFRAKLAELDRRRVPLRIAACEVTAQLFVADALPDWLRNRDTAADMAIYEDLFSLKPADYDLLVVPADSLPPGMAGVEIGRIEWGLFASPNYLHTNPVRAGSNSLAGHKLILASGSLARVGMYRWLTEQGGQAVFSSSSPLAQREACARGQGVAMLPLALARDDPRIEQIEISSFGQSPVWLVANELDASHPRIAAFLLWARRHFRADRYPGRGKGQAAGAMRVG